MQIAYCNDQIIQIIAWEKQNKTCKLLFKIVSELGTHPWLYTEISAPAFHSWAEFQFDTAYLVTCVRVPKSRDLIDCSTSIQPMYYGKQRDRGRGGLC